MHYYWIIQECGKFTKNFRCCSGGKGHDRNTIKELRKWFTLFVVFSEPIPLILNGLRLWLLVPTVFVHAETWLFPYSPTYQTTTQDSQIQLKLGFYDQMLFCQHHDLSEENNIYSLSLQFTCLVMHQTNSWCDYEGGISSWELIAETSLCL